MLTPPAHACAAWSLLAFLAACGGNVTDAPDDGGPGTYGGSSGSGSGSSGASGGAPSSGAPSGSGAQAAPPPLPTPATKVDLLFDIDNSASMADKQQYLAQAIPDLVTRLVTPDCLDANGNVTGVSDVSGHCATGTAEFAPVRDMHIGIVSSSLGPRLGDACPTTGAFATQTLANGGSVPRHNDDEGHLLNRASDPANLSNYTETALPDAEPSNFLAWAPGAPAPASGAVAIGDPAVLQQDFQELVVGVHQFGCGIESQLESWYRFLVQPDPYASLTVVNGQAQWVGVDTVLLAQRAAFLRPDSLVAVIVLSDENDSEVDVRSFGGSGYNFMSQAFKPPRGTAVCATNPADPGCTSCDFAGHGSDPSCQLGPYSSPTDWGYDLNLRHVHEQQKYGVSVQFPVQRYVYGLTSPAVPNRDDEYPANATAYTGLTNRSCTNPLFAAKLPVPGPGTSLVSWQPSAAELCNLAPSGRPANFIYYAHIGGVPHQLLQQDPTNPSSPQKATLTDADWRLILGNDPQNYDYSGIDPHMIESYQPRTGAMVPEGGFPVASETSPDGTDPISRREFITDSTSPAHQGLLVDLEYACTFPLATPRACDNAATMADPTLQDSCECQPPVTGSFTPAEVPPVCDAATPTQQDYAKAYPTVRELLLAQLLGKVPGANAGVVSSICPIHTVEAQPGDPLYGYRPAMSALANRLKGNL